jgi:hypothetical protein
VFLLILLVVCGNQAQPPRVQSGIYLREQCWHSGYGLFKGELCHRKPGCLLTWEPFGGVPKFLSQLTALHVECDFLSYLRSAGALSPRFGILNPGSALDIFPKLTYKKY